MWISIHHHQPCALPSPLWLSNALTTFVPVVPPGVMTRDLKSRHQDARAIVKRFPARPLQCTRLRPKVVSRPSNLPDDLTSLTDSGLPTGFMTERRAANQRPLTHHPQTQHQYSLAHHPQTQYQQRRGAVSGPYPLAQHHQHQHQ